MDDKDWIILKTISEEKNITKAAERLYISQPALTYRVKNLETEFNTKLIFRNSSGVQLTHQGEYMLSYATEMLHKLRDTKEQIKNMENKVQGVLRLGSSSIFAHYNLPEILKLFLEKYPDVEISLKTGLSAKVYQMLQKEEASVAIIRGDYLWTEEKYLIAEEPLCLVSHEPIRFMDLPHMPQINYLTDSSLQPIVNQWWRDSFFQPPLITMDVDSMDTCRRLVMHGLGWAILPETGLREHSNLYRQNLRWRNGSPILRRTWLMYSTAFCKSTTVNAFIQFIREFFHSK